MKIENLDQVVNQLKTKLPIYLATILGKDPGKNGFHCLNPEHNDQAPSAYLNPHSEFTTGKCFGCNVGFDIFNRLGEHLVVEVEADFVDGAGLFAAQDIARAAHCKVLFCDYFTRPKKLSL